METQDRLGNVALFAAAIAAWIAVAIVVTTRDPIADPSAGVLGAILMGIASGLTLAPVFWLAVFAVHRRIAFRGDWVRALRRGAWVGGLVALLVALRIEGVFSLPIAIFVVAMAVLAEVALSVER